MLLLGVKESMSTNSGTQKAKESQISEILNGCQNKLLRQGQQYVIARRLRSVYKSN